MTDRLREALRDLADSVEPADLYDRAVHRSRRIARREATIGTGVALAAIVLLASGLWRLPEGKTKEPPYALRSAATATTAPASPRPPATTHRVPAPTHRASASAAAKRHKNQPQVAPTTASPRSRSLADLPGHIFYQQAGADPDVVRLSPGGGGVETVLPKAPSPVGISPDGHIIAYAEGGALLVEHAGGPPEQLATGVSTDDQPPAWSPDGDRLLVESGSAPAVLEVGSGTLTPLAGPLADGQHFRWSGDGSALVYATSFCSLKVAAGGSDTSVPVLGDRQPADNPDGLAACKPTSVDATGGRVTVPLQSTGETGADGPDTADAVVDTATGQVVALPVTGSVVGTSFDPAGRLLVRSRHGDVTTLSLFAPDGKLLVQATEPARLRGLDLLAYTR